VAERIKSGGRAAAVNGAAPEDPPASSTRPNGDRKSAGNRVLLRKEKLDRLRASYAARAGELKREAHPLDPLSPDEIEATVELVRSDARFGYGMRFITIMLVEPTMTELGKKGRKPERIVEIVMIDGSERSSLRVTANLTRSKIKSWEPLEGIQPAIVTDEFPEVEIETKLDGRVQNALRRRGLDLQQRNLVNIDPWSAGNFGEPEEHERRIARGLFYVRDHDDDNAYAHPIDGLSVVFDLHDSEVIKVEDEEVRPIPRESGNFAAAFQTRLRDDIKPLEVVQPDGPSFQVDGWRVHWQKWSLRVGFNQREGLTLHQIEYDDGGNVRPVLFRASVAEMTVPYGDVAFTERRKNAFDAGEYGLGLQANSLERGCDCLGEIYYFDACCVDTYGELVPKNNAICLHEEDAGILWKHWDLRTDKTEVRRSRRLVISFIATIGNYEYGFYWYLYQDGAIEFEAKATGVVQTGALHDGEVSKYGATLGPNLYGPHHQHFFCVRLDPMVDGPKNRFTEVNTVADPMGPDNPYGNAFYPVRTTFETELEAQRRINLESARTWLIESSQTENALGGRPAYKLAPGDNCLPFAQPGSSIAGRAAYMWNHVWVTPFDKDERYPAGEFPNQHPGGDGLPRWTKADRSIMDRELVVWYVLGHHHIVRPEDWPVMPVSRLGFALKPVGFFTRNPALDVPPSTPHGCHTCETPVTARHDGK
jgi:primary-amine oxidase